MRKSIVLIPVLATLAACATAPVPLKGEFSMLVPSAAVADNHAGERIRWGGEIIKVSPGEHKTHEPNRDVHEEDRTPTQRTNECATDRRARNKSGTDDHGKNSECSTSTPVRKVLSNDRGTIRHEHRSAETLKNPR